tara:strand:- start:25 stop:339 length:315 start_codon:yes stop_codon:yes gene_type:complete
MMEVRASAIKAVEAAKDFAQDGAKTATVLQREQRVRVADRRSGANADLEPLGVPIGHPQLRPNANEVATCVGDGDPTSKKAAARKAGCPAQVDAHERIARAEYF